MTSLQEVAEMVHLHFAYLMRDVVVMPSNGSVVVEAEQRVEIATCLVDSGEVGFCFDSDCVSLVMGESCLEQVYQRCYLQMSFPLDLLFGLHLVQHDPCHDHDRGLAPFPGPCSGLGSDCVDNHLCLRRESLYRWNDCCCCGDYGFKNGWEGLRTSVSSRNARPILLQIVVHYASHLS